ncbi:unnamed protein product [Kuraishia capsulata CBS 1993]|uniref:ATP11 protein n=1 Tax=Kuraishia capsulata CBS 1993 TaxID=1382522 RepID=W6MTN9_9ASCO|nr:uncharacterized protein KUCA_T00001122001 [Kuraishia capsulata CBS 1993]CDK25155.1 unnamed protein product [Kuraishia capsulata CBS 1993]
MFMFRLGIRTDDLTTVLKDEIEAKKKEMNKVDPLAELAEYEQRRAAEAATKQNAKKTAEQNAETRGPISPDTPTQPYKRLESYINVEKFRELETPQIEVLWRSRFASKEEALSALVPLDAFDRLYANARANPSFVLPLPRDGDGIEVHYLQWSFVGPHTTHAMITSLAEYKLHREYARPHTTLMFHQELRDSNELILMNGLVEPSANITREEAQLLIMNMQRFYGALADSPASRRRVQLLEDFTKGSEGFSMEKIIEESQSLEN